MLFRTTLLFFKSTLLRPFSDVPTHILSLSKKIVLIASGESKAEAIKGLFSGKITTDNPASMLQMHRDVTVVVDKAAATLINE